MEPMSMMALASLIGSAGSVGGSLFSANQQNQNQQQELAFAQKNYLLQKQIAEALIVLAIVYTSMARIGFLSLLMQLRELSPRLRLMSANSK